VSVGEVTANGTGTLESQLERLSGVPRLVVACDYDGTLAPIVEVPSEARPLREGMVALRALSELSNTEVLVVSGRSLADLDTLAHFPESVHLVGSHGSEFDAGFVTSLSEQQIALRDRVLDAMREAAERGEGFRVESKPASVAFHYRQADPGLAERVVGELERGIASEPGVAIKRGKMVLELAVVETSKGTALETMRHRLGADAVVFFGDDVTDEDAFRVLCGPDVGVKVGEGETAAGWRVDSPEEVARCLAHLAELRESWLIGRGAVGISKHSALSDRRTMALVTPDARVTWLCAPRIDSPAIFAELLGGPSAGRFVIGPADGGEPTGQRYLNDSLVLETAFEGFTVTDFLDCSGGQPRQRAGRVDLNRLVRGTPGTRVRVEFAPRLDFGRMATSIQVEPDGLCVPDWPDPIVLRAPGIEWSVQPEGNHQTAVGEFVLGEHPVSISLRYGSGSLRARAIDGAERMEATTRYWDQWSERLRLPNVEPEQVKRSALMLYSLTYGPTGAVAAAGTTSLPEEIGGVRNWDYRFCWPRDAAVATLALVKLGSQSEAMAFLDWVLGVVERVTEPSRLSPIYTVTGGELTTEGEIGELAGYAGSRPVRIGNAASRQVQLDEFGPIVELVCELARRDAPLTPDHWRIVEAMVSAVRAKWSEADHGIWEIRHAPRHHVHSRVMCWLAVDRAIEASRLLRDKEPADWVALRDEIRDDVLAHGWSDDAGSYVGYYKGKELDAGCLWVGLSGLVPADDERYRRTVEAIERELGDGDGIYRYHYDDGLPGREGVFNICTTWLIRSLLQVGRVDDARRWWDRYLSLVGPTGLMAEEHDPERGVALGNVPQAYSHAGLIECAVALDGLG